MARKSKGRERLSSLEIDVIREIWQRQPASVADLIEGLSARQGADALQRGTMHVLLNRLEEKGWLTREKDGRGYRYSATISERDGLAEMTGEFQAKLFDGSSLALVQCLLRENKNLDQSEIDSLRDLLDGAEKELRNNRKKS